MYCLQCFSSKRILANHVNNCLRINGEQAINMPKQGENRDKEMGIRAQFSTILPCKSNHL